MWAFWQSKEVKVASISLFKVTPKICGVDPKVIELLKPEESPGQCGFVGFCWTVKDIPKIKRMFSAVGTIWYNA